MDDARPPSPAEPPVGAELDALVRRAQAGDAGALPRIREVLDRHPEVWQHLGDLSNLVERAWTAVLAAGHPLAAEAMKRAAGEMRAELAGERPGRLERMMVEQVVACWMEAKYLEA